MAVIQGMKRTQDMVTIADFQSAFIKQIESMITCYNEAHIVFDNYIDQSLKNKTRQKRAVSSTEYEISLEMKLTVSLKEILSSSKSKRCLTEMFAEGLLKTSKSSLNLVVVYGNKIKSRDSEDEHDIKKLTL